MNLRFTDWQRLKHVCGGDFYFFSKISFLLGIAFQVVLSTFVSKTKLAFYLMLLFSVCPRGGRVVYLKKCWSL